MSSRSAKSDREAPASFLRRKEKPRARTGLLGQRVEDLVGAWRWLCHGAAVGTHIRSCARGAAEKHVAQSDDNQRDERERDPQGSAVLIAMGMTRLGPRQIAAKARILIWVICHDVSPLLLTSSERPRGRQPA